MRPFIRRCVDVCVTRLRIFERKLELPEGELVKRHLEEKKSICESRCIKVPPAPGRKASALGAHTDFGR